MSKKRAPKAMPPFNMAAWLRQVEKNVSRSHIPQTEPSPFFATDLASEVLGHEKGRVPQAAYERVDRLAGRFMAGADFYEKMSVDQARKQPGKGRPRNGADLAFVYAMAVALHKSRLRFSWRCFQRGKSTHGAGGGTEKETDFQKICNAWLGQIDPARQDRPLTPHTFRMAKKHFDRRIKNHSG